MVTGMCVYLFAGGQGDIVVKNQQQQMTQRHHDSHHDNIIQWMFFVVAHISNNAEHEHARANHVRCRIADQNRAETLFDRSTHEEAE